MSNDPKSGGGPGDFDLDWEDALGDWEDGLKQGSARAESAPMPQKPPDPKATEAKPAVPASRQLYRPPTAGEVPSRPLARPPSLSAPPPMPSESGRVTRPADPSRTPALADSGRISDPGSDSLFDAMDDEMPTRVPSGAELHRSFADFDDEESGDATRVANIPRELIDSLTRKPATTHNSPTTPPPPGGPQSAGAERDDDIEAMLSGLDAEPVAAPARAASPPLGAPPALSRPAAPTPASPPRLGVAPASPAGRAPAAPAAPPRGLPGTRPAPVAPSATAPKPASAFAVPKPAALGGAGAPAGAIPKPGAFAVPKPGALGAAPAKPAAVPRPGALGAPLAKPPLGVPAKPAAVAAKPAPSASDPTAEPMLAPSKPTLAGPVAALAARGATAPAALDLDDDDAAFDALFGGAPSRPNMARPRMETPQAAPARTSPAVAAERAEPVAPAPPAVAEDAVDDSRALAALDASLGSDFDEEAFFVDDAPALAAAPASAEDAFFGDDALAADLGEAAPSPPASAAAAPAVDAAEDAFDDEEENATTTIARLDDDGLLVAPAGRPSRENVIAYSDVGADDDAAMADAADASGDVDAADDDAPIADTSDDDPESETETVTLSADDGDDDEEDFEDVVDEAPAPASRADRGAATALRTVRSRKPRAEHFSLVGRSGDATQARGALLLDLAGRSQGPARARLLAAAAELLAASGQPDDARELWAAAREADPSDVYVVRVLRRDAIARAEWSDVAALLTAEAALPIEPDERGMVLSALAELSLTQLGDAAAAVRAAKAASEARPRAFVPAMLLAEACFAADDEPGAYAALEHAAGAWDDPRGRAALLVEVARGAERGGDPARAAKLYARAATSDAETFDAAFGLTRSARAAGDIDTAITAAQSAADRAGDARVGEALRFGSARLADFGAKRPADAVRILEGARSIPALRARADATARAGDHDARIGALEAWAAAAGSTERALALLELAETRADGNDLEGADAALRDASLADASLGAVRVMREVLARRAGDSTRLARVVESGADGAPGAALSAAAKLARAGDSSERERELLARAVMEGEEPVCADTLVLDAAARAGDLEATRSALRRQAERATPERRVGPLLVLSDMAARAGDLPVAEQLLREAREGARGEAVVLRPLARLLAGTSALDSAAMWLEESSTALGERSAFAATSAGGVLAAGGGDAPMALRRALDSAPGYGPALWALESVARVRGDLDALREVHEGLAERATSAQERGGRLVRAALLRAANDPAGAVTLLERARHDVPADVIVRDLLLRLSADLPAVERAALIEAEGDGASGELLRAARLRAAAAWEDAGDPARAASLLRAVLAEGAEPFAEAALDRLELASGAGALVSGRRFDAVRAAEDDDAKVLALERLADLDLRERSDAASATLSLQALLETAPGHLPSLRALERYYLEHGRDEELLGVERKLVAHVNDPGDLAHFVRFATRLELRPEDALGDAADEMLLGAAPRAQLDLWLARHVEGAAHARGSSSVQTLAARAAGEHFATATENATAMLRVAETLERTGAPGEAAEALMPAVHTSPEHPVAAEELARLWVEAASPRGAAEAYETAARAARVPQRIVRLWHRAGVIWQDEEDDAERAVAAYEEAAKVDLAYADLFDRLAALLEQRNQLARLAELTDARVALGGDSNSVVMLQNRSAAIREKLGDAEGAKTALRAALALDPDRLDALRRLAELCVEGHDWRGAAEAYIRIARLTKEIDELRDVFYRLGGIYDEHMPDPKRAEAAFRRVLKLAPNDLGSMTRLARLYEREQQWPAAVEVLQQLVFADPDPDQVRQHRLDLATAYEKQGQGRQAEAAFEATRRLAPTDLIVLRAFAEFYQRQNAQSALAMHLNRGVTDFRQAIETDPADAAAWHGLVEVLGWRGRQDAARAAASAAAAFGIVDSELVKLLDASGGVPGAGSAAADAELEELVAPSNLPLAARTVFRLAGDAIDKTLPPLDLKAIRAERVSVRDLPYRAQIEEVARWFGVTEIEIWTTASAPRVCLPISSQPVAILIGRDLLASNVDPRERLFLLARAVKIARANLVAAVRAQPADLAIAVAGIMRHYDPHFAPAGVNPAALDDAAKRFGKALNKKVRDELYPNVYEMLGASTFDAMRLGAAASELGDRVALVATGSVPAAVSALLRLAGADIPAQDPRRTEAVRGVVAARGLIGFAIADAHFEARHRSGADRR